MVSATIQPLPSTRIQIPYPGLIGVSPEGVSDVHFMGLGQTPDFHVVMNPDSPADSYVLLEYVDGRSEYYRMTSLPPDVLSDQMVISYSKPTSESWVWMGEEVQLAGKGFPLGQVRN